MAEPKGDIGLEILEGLRELKRGESGRVTLMRSIGQIRESAGLSQAQFARLLGVSARTLQEWEQGRRAPSGAARTLLVIASRDPKVLLNVVAESRDVRDLKGMIAKPAKPVTIDGMNRTVARASSRK